METVFLKLVNMSITASWLVLAVLVLRFLLKKAPKSIHCVLWALVALRLVLPFSLESTLSLIPSTEPLPEEFLYAATPQLDSGIPAVNQTLNPIIAESLTPMQPVSANPTQINSFIFSQIWILGMVTLLLYAIVSYFMVRRKVRICIRLDDTVRLCDHISSPFILGVLKPQIYLPSDLDPQTAALVLAHEHAHLKRRDHWWKPLGFVLLSIYWFNPVLWLAYVLLCRDIELACDEKVIQDLDVPNKRAYSMALLECSVPRRMISACPLAFGEVSVKSRIKSVLNYKKPAFWIIVLAIIASAVTAVCFLTDPKDEGPTAYEVTSDLWIYDVQSINVTVWEDSGAHGAYLTKSQTEKLSEIIHDLKADEFTKKKPSKHLLYAELECEDFDIELHWDGEYSYFTFDPATNERITSNRRSVKNEELNAFLAEVMQAEYRLKEGTYVPFYGDSLFGVYPDSLELAQTYRYEVTEDSFTVHYMESGEAITYSVDWCWQGHAEAWANLPVYDLRADVGHFGIRPNMDDQSLKYQHLFDNCHLLYQDGILYLINGVKKQENGRPLWKVYYLTEDRPGVLPPESLEACFANATGHIGYADVYVRSGDCRPGRFGMTEAELELFSTILEGIPEGAIRPGKIVDDYHIWIYTGKHHHSSVAYYTSIHYDGERIALVWNSPYTDEKEIYEVDYQPLAVFLDSLMQPERINDYCVMLDTKNDAVQYVSYSHEDITITLVKIIGWEYEIVPYKDKFTDFGIRAKPEWLDDWLFFGYMQGELVPSNTFLYKANVNLGTRGDGNKWQYLFEKPIEGEILWREWPEMWKMIYCHHDGGTYYIYNEGTFDERLSEHDRGGYEYIERSFFFGIATEDALIARSRDYIYLPDYENPEVSYEPSTHRWHVVWHKKNSDEIITVKLDSAWNDIVE